MICNKCSARRSFVSAVLFLLLIVICLSSVYISRIRFTDGIQVSVHPPVSSGYIQVFAETPSGKIFPLDTHSFSQGYFYRLRVVAESPNIPEAFIVVVKSGNWKQNISLNDMNVSWEKKNSSLSHQTIYVSPPSFHPEAPLGRRLQAFFREGPVLKVMIFLFLIILFVPALYLFLKRFIRKILSGELTFRTLMVTAFRRLAVLTAGLVAALLVITVLLEIFLRIAGSVYRNPDPSTKAGKTGHLKVMCVGDSFTRGIGSTPGNDYPSQLQRICDSLCSESVDVINLGEAGQNSSQIVMRLRKAVEKEKPDVAVMLFGMANSWNYWGYSPAQSFWHRFRVYRLYKRILRNLEYKTYGTEVEKNRKERASRILSEAQQLLNSGNPGPDAYNRMATYHMVMLDYGHAILWFQRGVNRDSLSKENFLGLRLAFPSITLESQYSGVSGKNEMKPLFLHWLDYMSRIHPNHYYYPFLKSELLFDNGRSEEAFATLTNAARLNHTDFSILYLPLRYLSDSIVKIFSERYYLRLVNEYPAAASHCYAALGFRSLKLNDLSAAKKWFGLSVDADSLNIHAVAGYGMSCYLSGDKNTAMNWFYRGDRQDPGGSFIPCIAAYALIGSGDTITAIKWLKKALIRDKNSHAAYYIASLIPSLPAYAASPLNRFLKFRSSFKKTTRFSSSFYFEPITDYHYYFFRDIVIDYFQPLAERRTMTLSDSLVFSWIQSDIDEATDFCESKGIRVIAMNYPLLPPPCSEEISYWARNTGQLWQQTAEGRQLMFVNNDSLFDLAGKAKESLFEPRKGGSEHCNDKGYGLMAMNLFNAMERAGVVKRKKH